MFPNKKFLPSLQAFPLKDKSTILLNHIACHITFMFEKILEKYQVEEPLKKEIRKGIWVSAVVVWKMIPKDINSLSMDL